MRLNERGSDVAGRWGSSKRVAVSTLVWSSSVLTETSARSEEVVDKKRPHLALAASPSFASSLIPVLGLGPSAGDYTSLVTC